MGGGPTAWGRTMDQTLMAAGLAICVALVGMPHGGLDHLFGQAVFRPSAGRWWRPAFLLAYLGVAAVVAAGWFVAPAVTIVLFFAISAVHFGDDRTQGWFAPLDGGLVVSVPLLTRPDEVASLLAWIIPDGDFRAVRQAVGEVQPLLWFLTAAFAGHLLFLLTQGRVWAAARPIAFAAIFAALPVLIGFGLYFCGWHSVREMAVLSRRADPSRPWRGLLTVVRLAAPLASLAVVFVAAGGWWFSAGRELTPVVVQAVFMGLSAVAVPHILLHAVAERIGADPFADRRVFT